MTCRISRLNTNLMQCGWSLRHSIIAIWVPQHENTFCCMNNRDELTFLGYWYRTAYNIYYRISKRTDLNLNTFEMSMTNGLNLFVDSFRTGECSSVQIGLKWHRIIFIIGVRCYIVTNTYYYSASKRFVRIPFIFVLLTFVECRIRYSL